MSAKRLERVLRSVLVLVVTTAVLGPGAATAQVTGMGPLTNAPGPGDWPMYHRSYDAHRYSPLSQINRDNVKKLQVAWVHQPGKIDQGLESTPIVVDGIMYYSASYNRVFALDGATGKEIWHYYPKLDPVVSTLFFQPYNRGVAFGQGKIFMGTLDGHVVALDAKTGKEVWKTQVVDTKTCSCNFTGAPIVVKDKVHIGQTAGEYPIVGYLYALNAEDGKIVWKFNTIKDDPKSWGGDSAKFGGGGGWMTPSYDPESNLVIWGTSNPAPDYDWGGARPGDNLYTSSVVALNADTGKLAWYHQEIPHDDWDYDSALGESLLLDVPVDGKMQKLAVHQNKSGFVFVYDRTNGKIVNVYPMIHTYNFVERIDPKTGELIGRKPPRLGKPEFICPWIAGGRGWNAGSYSSKSKLWYNSANEVCEEVTVEKQPPVTQPAAQLFFGGDQVAKHPPGGTAYGHLDALDPVTGVRKWTVNYKYPPLSGVLSTAGDLVINGDVEGVVHAYDAENGQDLWSFRTGSGIRGGLISYTAGGKQYIAVPSGLGSLVMGLYPHIWPEVADFPAGAAMFVFTLKD
jgi:PQQ-dependent dehydrogenase (methanol/ethanol family)